MYRLRNTKKARNVSCFFYFRVLVASWLYQKLNAEKGERKGFAGDKEVTQGSFIRVLRGLSVCSFLHAYKKFRAKNATTAMGFFFQKNEYPSVARVALGIRLVQVFQHSWAT